MCQSLFLQLRTRRFVTTDPMYGFMRYMAGYRGVVVIGPPVGYELIIDPDGLGRFKGIVPVASGHIVSFKNANPFESPFFGQRLICQ